MGLGWTIGLALLPAAAAAAAAQTVPPRISVSGRASVSTLPDRATIGYTVRGEGTTSDIAVAAMVAKRRRIDDGLASIDAAAEPRVSDVSVTEVRGAACKRDGDDETPHLSTGACAVIGYVASMESSVRTKMTTNAGTIVGLLARLEALGPHLDGFALADSHDAQRRAIAAALVDARGRAEAIAAAMGIHLGRVISASTDMTDHDTAQDIVVTATRRSAPPAMMAPPIAVDLTPRPIETRAQVSVTYEIAP